MLRRDEYQCQECKRFGKAEAGDVVHHILPVERCTGARERLKLDSRNLITLCRKCHNAMHERETHALTARGRDLLRRSGVLGIIPPSSDP